MKTIDQTVKMYLEHYPHEENNIQLLLCQLNRSSDLCDRKRLPGHITASAIVIENDKMLMIFHPFLKKWLQPGGHVEEGEMPLEAAQRELLEETGFQAHADSWHATSLIPFDIDVHSIPKNEKKGEEAHLHYDFRYLLSLNKNVAANDQKDHEIDWIDFENIEEANLIRLLKKFKNKSIG